MIAPLFGASSAGGAPNNRAMQTDRSDDVVARVVAWHNRHPLATRITATQVHSVGVVSLPFAVRGAVVPARVEVPTEAAQTPPPAPEAPAAETPPAEQPTADLAAETAPAEAAAPPAVAAVNAQLPARPVRWNPLAWVRARSAWRALFSEDFIAPLRPGRVARWAAQHAVSERPLDAQAPQRDVAPDPALRRAGTDAPELPLFLLTAAIGVDDQRLRVLLAPAGNAVIGPRHYSRPRLVAVTGSSLTVLALVVGAGLWQQRQVQPAAVSAAASAPAVTSAVASAPAAASAPASAAAVMAAASDAASAPAVEQAQAPDAATPEEPDHASVHSPPREAPAPAVAEAPPRVAGARPRRGRVELPPLVDKLDDAQRHELRLAGRALRGEPAHPVDARSWALVTQPLSDRRQTERVAAQLHAVALLQPMPMRAELMHADGGWRAVFWPFPTERDAEKVRLALADKGLRTQVVEF